MQNNVSLINRLFDALNRHDVDGILACVDKNIEWVSAEGTSHGIDEYRNNVEFWFTAFPDAKCEIKNLVCTDEWCTVEFVGTGTHNGPIPLPTGNIAPTGRNVELSFCEVYRCSNGKIVVGHSYYDMYSLLSQLGQFPKTRQAGA